MRFLQILGIFALLGLLQAEVDIPEDFSMEDLILLNKIKEGDDPVHLAEKEAMERDLNRENEMAYSDVDPCMNAHCGAGRICLAKGDVAECVCIPDCPSETNPRRKVCTSNNETWPSDCEVYRQKCLCDTNDPSCVEIYSHVNIDYYGECRQLPECSDEEMADFPRRMREWLFNVMRDLAQRSELSEHYMDMELEAETNETRRWSNAAVWKWCDLDGDTDRSISRHELFPVRAPLVSLEHCIAPFLDSCDTDANHRISLKEWGKCLELDEADLDERCETIHSATASPPVAS